MGAAGGPKAAEVAVFGEEPGKTQVKSLRKNEISPRNENSKVYMIYFEHIIRIFRNYLHKNVLQQLYL